MTDTQLTSPVTRAASPSPVLAIQDLSVSFHGRSGENQALKGISFAINPGEIVAVVGESGSGKSVTSLAVMGLLSGNGRVDRGSMQFRDRSGNLHALETLNEAQRRTLRGNEMAMIFQEPMTSLNPVLRIDDQLTEALRDHQQCDRKQAYARVRELLRQVRIADVDRVMKSYPHSLSGGMRQRVMIAQALACDPQLLIADEPTTALDVTVQARILHILRELQREKQMAVLFITHDMGVVAEIADRVVVMLFGAFMAYTLMPHIQGEDAWSLALDPGFVFPLIIGLTGVLFAVITQICINVLNLYSGSIALSNTMDMAFNYRPGRQWWMLLVWLLGVVFYICNILQYTGTFLSITGILTNTWVLIILADYFICRKVLHLAPSDFVEFRKAYLRMWNPSGVIALYVAFAIGAAGVLGLYPMVYASFIAMLVGPVLHVAISVATRGSYYFKTFPEDMQTNWKPSDAYHGPKPVFNPLLSKEAE
ncbi:ATP-binding cassette domain-containing protein [Pantoea vagans]|nr:ATP-binding cassette domain-containing protein [Pantoea vagans]NBB57314.1 ATP-binding cassette domain-containing protein [Pantoea vagans]